MSAISQITAAARQADSEHPDYKIVNTKVTCFALLKRALQLAGPDFAFVGKTENMDGSGKYTPPGFQPFTVKLPREDGQLQEVTITAVSMDACWHMPSGTQIKVIVNSTDGEIAEGGSGKPARLDSYPIEEFKDGKRQYRWHNPPVSQTLVNGGQPVPLPPPPQAPQAPTTHDPYPGDAVFDSVGAILFADYAEAGRGPDSQMGRWFGRVIYDWIAKVTPSLEASITKHRAEWRAALGL